MNKKSKNIAIFSSLVLLCVLHMLASPRRFRDSISISPVWLIDVPTAKMSVSADEKAIPFRLGRKIGYFSKDGEMLMRESFDFKATISPSLSAICAEDSAGFILRRLSDKSETEVSVSGFPFVQQDRCYVFLPGGCSVSQIDSSTGIKKWTLNGFSPITAFRSSEDAAVAGFADGEILCVDGNGNKIADFYPGGSEREIISNADISPDSRMVAAICGLNRQRIVVARISSAQSKIFFHRYLSGNLRDRAFVRFSQDGGNVLFSSPNGLGIVNVASQRMLEISMAGRIVDATEAVGTDVCAVLLKKGDSFEVVLVEDFRKVIGRFSFKSDDAFIAAQNNRIFVGSGEKISALEILKK